MAHVRVSVSHVGASFTHDTVILIVPDADTLSAVSITLYVIESDPQ